MRHSSSIVGFFVDRVSYNAIQLCVAVLLLPIMIAFLGTSRTLANNSDLIENLVVAAELSDTDERDKALLEIERNFASDQSGIIAYMRFVNDSRLFRSGQLYGRALETGVLNVAFGFGSELRSDLPLTSFSEIENKTRLAFVRLRARSPMFGQFLFPDDLQKEELFEGDLLRDPSYIAMTEAAALGSPLAVGFLTSTSALLSEEKAKLGCRFVEELIAEGGREPCHTLLGKQVTGVSDENRLLASSYVNHVATTVSARGVSRYSSYCSFIRYQIKVIREAVCADIVSLLDLVCSLHVDGGPYVQLNGLPICRSEKEGSLFRTLVNQYKIAFSVDISILKD